MARFSFVVWDGGGNLGPAIGIAQALTARGHRCRFLGYRAQRAHVERQGFAFDELARSGDYDVHRAAPGPAQQLDHERFGPRVGVGGTRVHAPEATANRERTSAYGGAPTPRTPGLTGVRRCEIIGR